jgi:hypothetical protein
MTTSQRFDLTGCTVIVTAAKALARSIARSSPAPGRGLLPPTSTARPPKRLPTPSLLPAARRSERQWSDI